MTTCLLHGFLGDVDDGAEEDHDFDDKAEEDEDDHDVDDNAEEDEDDHDDDGQGYLEN